CRSARASASKQYATPAAKANDDRRLRSHLAKRRTLAQTIRETLSQKEGRHACNRGGSVRREEAGRGGGRRAGRAASPRGAGAVGGQRRLPQRFARDHGRLAPSPARRARSRGGGRGREGRAGGRDRGARRPRLLELHPVVRQVLVL